MASITNSSQPPNAPDLSQYLDYRSYLEDFLKYKRSQKLGIRKYSPSDFAAAANLKSPQYLKLVINRQRNLSVDGAQKFCMALSLNKEDCHEFLLLVQYNQATEPKERYDFLEKLAEHRAKNVKNIKSAHWLKVIVYSICEGIGGRYTLTELKDLIGDKCKINQLQTALTEMLEDRAIRSETVGDIIYYAKSPGQSTLSNDIPLDVIKKIQSDLLLLGLESLFSDSPNERDLGSFSIALTKPEYEDTKFEIRKFRKSLLRNLLMKREQSHGDQVYQVQFQIFPVTKTVVQKPKGGKKISAKGFATGGVEIGVSESGIPQNDVNSDSDQAAKGTSNRQIRNYVDSKNESGTTESFEDNNSSPEPSPKPLSPTI